MNKHKLPDVLFQSCSKNEPLGHGFVPIGVAKMIRLTAGGVYYAYSHAVGPDGTVGAVNVVRHHVSRWLRPDRLGGSGYDGKTVKLINWMQQAGAAGGEPSAIPSPLIYAVTDGPHDIDLDSKTVQGMVLEAIGPTGDTTPCVTAQSPGGVIREVVMDSHATMISFSYGETEEVVELPEVSRLYPWVRPGVETEPGAEIADLVPRYEYTWEQFLGFKEATRRMVVSEVLKAHTHQTAGLSVIPLVFLPKYQRKHVAHGGVVTDWRELVLENRKPQLVLSTLVDSEVGTFDYGQDAFFGAP
jgi:hypothetical protein